MTFLIIMNKKAYDPGPAYTDLLKFPIYTSNSDALSNPELIMFY